MRALVHHLENSALLQSDAAAALTDSFEAAHQALLSGHAPCIAEWGIHSTKDTAHYQALRLGQDIWPL